MTGRREETASRPDGGAPSPEAPAARREAGKQQFNVYLPPGLIKRAKHAAIDHSTSLSGLVEAALTAHLDRLEEGP